MSADSTVDNYHICPTEGVPNASASSDCKFSFSLVSSADVHKALLRLKACKNTGADNHDPNLLNLSAPLICPHVAHIFNQAFLTGMIPAL